MMDSGDGPPKKHVATTAGRELEGTGGASQSQSATKAEESSCFSSWYDLKCHLVSLIFPGSPFGTGIGLQDIDGYRYYPSFICPRERIDLARNHEWQETDAFLSSYPKSGTHFCGLVMVLIAHKGQYPEKTDLHTLFHSVEFKNGAGGDNSLDYNEPSPFGLPLPRVLISHMPQHHVKMNDVARFLYVMRDPVSTLASMRRMELLMFGPILCSKLDTFIEYNIKTRDTGWLDHVLGWWQVRDRSNLLLVTYEEMVTNPAEAVRKIANHMRVNLTDDEARLVVMKMDKQWALQNVDPYLFKAHTPFSPPDRDSTSKSGFIVNSDAIKEKLTKEQERSIREEYTRKIKAVMEDTGDASAAANATSFYNAHNRYFIA